MDKQKKIEEMARSLTLCKRNSCVGCGVECIENRMAQAIYNAGYRKIPEGAVVLTKAEYNSLRLLAKECIEWRWKYCNMNATESENKGGGENEQV